MQLDDRTEPIDAGWVGEHPWGLVIDGEVVPATAGRTFTKEDPSTEDPLCEVPDATADDVDRAVRSSADAFRDWRRMDVRARAILLRRMGEILREHRDELATLDAACRAAHGSGIAQASPAALTGLLQKAETDGTPFVKTLKALTVHGYGASRIGATQALAYDAVPGRYRGCIDLAPGQRTWAER